MGDKVGFIQLPHQARAANRRQSRRVKLPPPRPGARQHGGRPAISARRGPVTTAIPRRRDRRDQGRPTASGAGRNASPEARAPAHAKIYRCPPTRKVITIKPPIVVRELAEQLKQKPFQIIADLMELGVFATVNQAIDEKIAAASLRQIRFPF